MSKVNNHNIAYDEITEREAECLVDDICNSDWGERLRLELEAEYPAQADSEMPEIYYDELARRTIVGLQDMIHHLS